MNRPEATGEAEGHLPLSEVVDRWMPSTNPPVASWSEQIGRFWCNEPTKMTALRSVMSTDGWPDGPAELGADGYVWDGQHRIAAALDLGWHDRSVPVVYV